MTQRGESRNAVPLRIKVRIKCWYLQGAKIQGGSVVGTRLDTKSIDYNHGFAES